MQPDGMNDDESPFYLAINHGCVEGSLKWYKKQPLGVNILSKMMSFMAKACGLKENVTNHSVRKTMCSQLLHKGVPATTIMQLSGRENVASVNNYAVASLQQQKAMCSLLSDDDVSHSGFKAIESSYDSVVLHRI